MEQLDKVEKVKYLYKFLKEFAQLKSDIKSNITEYNFLVDIEEENLPYYGNYLEYFSQNVGNENNEIIKIRKPEFSSCPKPAPSFANKILYWENFEKDVIVKEDEHITEVEQISYAYWYEQRENWRQEQYKIKKVNDFFFELYQMYAMTKQTNMEIVVANAFLRSKKDACVNHPLLIKRVAIVFDEKENSLCVYNTDFLAELYTGVLQKITCAIDTSNVAEYAKLLEDNDVHPLDNIEVLKFIKNFIHTLSPKSVYLQDKNTNISASMEELFVYNRPVLLLKNHTDRTVEAIDKIIKDLESNEVAPAFIGDIVAGGSRDISSGIADSFEEKLAAVGGESIEVFLSKPANGEQLAIAKKIENNNAVLVQGPPGTGKTHTIANLLGHFLAMGKRVLVTSHTKKALTVLKDKIEPELQDLCVSLLGDTNADMQKSVAGINTFIGKHDVNKLIKEKQNLLDERQAKFKELADVRKKIFGNLQKEYESIVVSGKGISPVKAAKFVQKHSELLEYIPGNITPGATMPCSYEELVKLYASNMNVSKEEENELAASMPSPKELISPEEFSDDIIKYNCANLSYSNMVEVLGLQNVHYTESNLKFNFANKNININLTRFDSSEIEVILNKLEELSTIEKIIVSDAFNLDDNTQLWRKLNELLQETYDIAYELKEFNFDNEINLSSSALQNIDDSIVKIRELRQYYQDGGKFGFIDRKLRKNHLYVLRDYAIINGHIIDSIVDCDYALKNLFLEKNRELCAKNWNKLFGDDILNYHDFSNFEADAIKYIPLIERSLLWKDEYYLPIRDFVVNCGFSAENIFAEEKPEYSLETVLNGIEIAKNLVVFINSVKKMQNIKSIHGESLNVLRKYGANVCMNLINAINNLDGDTYKNEYFILNSLYNKFEIVQSRNKLLAKISMVAPMWAESIKNRIGEHGKATVLEEVADAWLCKQYYVILNDLHKDSLQDLQNRSVRLAKEYRKLTALCARKLAWLTLMQKIESNSSLKQYLNTWALYIKKIGKGTGKHAAKYKAEARNQMKGCKDVIPVWIMPIGLVLDNFEPCRNNFDIVIIDEASQSDISALAVAYMGKKLIVVGDDEQVSPIVINKNLTEEKITVLQNMYLKGHLSNAALYNASTSLYDIVKTTFSSIMLLEHFRCVPDIIAYSNKLSYNGKIKPLRENSSSKLLPAVVNYRVYEGLAIGKLNNREAHNICALMKACMEQPEYAGKTFGVISLLGNEQGAKIASLFNKYDIDIDEIEQRDIICGDSASFQGDERDVIFLSMVDSRKDDGPLALKGYGNNDVYKKRYNVATSRAKNQLWVVHSLDAGNDLKLGDLRKDLLEFADNPRAYSDVLIDVAEKADSPFEEDVAKYLISHGYHIEQQREAGSYRIDMVVISGKKEVAIECDGERYHSGFDKIQEDMQRQAILERMGWTFIRIRGSEYYKNSEVTMQRVISELSKLGIGQEKMESIAACNTDSDLLQRVKARAEILLREVLGEEILPRPDVIVDVKPKQDSNVVDKTTQEDNFTETVVETVVNEEVTSAIESEVKSPKISRGDFKNTNSGKIKKEVSIASNIINTNSKQKHTKITRSTMGLKNK